jgi:hypothetical protein
MGGGPGHLAVMADIERALGRPERAIELSRASEVGDLDRAASIELAIVAAGARRDLGELAAAVVGLQLPELDPARREPWSARLFYAYADNLLAVGRTAEAEQWFLHAADADDEGTTDAARRLAELTGGAVRDDADDILFGEEDVPVDAAPTTADDREDGPDIDGDHDGADPVDAAAGAPEQALGGEHPGPDLVAAEVTPTANDPDDVRDADPVDEVPSSAADPVSTATTGVATTEVSAAEVATPEPDGAEPPDEGAR